MSLIEIVNRFPTQESCVAFIESIRFKDGAYCPHCGSVNVAKKIEKRHIGRWNCHDCTSSFKAVQGTMFHGTKIELQKWFMAISLMMHAKKSISSYQLSRDLDLNQKTAWYMQQRIRSEMMRKEGKALLQGIIETEETYVGGKPRKTNKRNDDDNDTPKN